MIRSAGSFASRAGRRACLWGSLLSLVVAGFAAAGASAATSIRPEFAKGLGSVLPTGGGTTEVNISCPDRGSGNCRGSVSIVPRGTTERALGKRVLASKSFTLRGGWDGDLKLRLDGPARSLLCTGPCL